MEQIVYVIARKRTGTTSLEEALGQIPDAYNLGETFHLQKPEVDNFYRFLANESLGDWRFAHPDFLQQGWERFLRTVCDRESKQRLIVDLKLDYLEVLPGILWDWDALPDRRLSQIRIPKILFVENVVTKIVYLRRRNLLARLVSEKRARTTDWWGTQHGYEDHPLVKEKNSLKRPLHMPSQALISQIEWETQEGDFFAELLPKLADTTVIYYEDLYDSQEAFSSLALDRLMDFLGAPRFETRQWPVNVKQSRETFEQVIENAEEVRLALDRHGYGWMWQ